MREHARDPLSSEARTLDEYWDDVVRLAPATPVPPAGTASDLTTVVRQLHSTGDADQRRPNYEERLLRDLLAMHQESTTMSSAASIPLRPAAPPLWRDNLAASLRKRAGVNRPGSQRWFPALVSAALILITLGIAGYAILDRNGAPGPGGPAVVAPATPSPSAEDDGVLLEFPLPADVVPDDGFGAAGVRFYTMAPGTVAAWNGELSALNPGIWANYVLEGSMTMVADGPVEVVRANGTRERAAAGTEIVLAAGDAVIHRAEESAEWTSLGSAEVQIVSLVVLSDNAIIYPQPDFWDATGYDVDGPAPIPAGDWVVRLEELQLEPDGAISAPESPSTQYGVTRADPLAYLAKGMDGQLTLRLADAPTTVYVFTLEWLGETTANPSP